MLFLKEKGAPEYDTVVCITSLSKDDTVDEIDSSSACGPDSSPGVLNISYGVEGQHLQDPDSGKVSGTNLRIWLRAKTELDFLISPLDPILGDEIEEGSAYLSSLSSTYAFDSVGTFTATLRPIGTPTLTISEGS